MVYEYIGLRGITKLAAAVHTDKILGGGIFRHMLFDIVYFGYGVNINNKK
jgi:hypothetical protein